jgi:hypothetical protein
VCADVRTDDTDRSGKVRPSLSVMATRVIAQRIGRDRTRGREHPALVGSWSWEESHESWNTDADGARRRRSARAGPTFRSASSGARSAWALWSRRE